ncbi:MAG: ABC transporter ATP-binding protein [Rubellimicrobium sp.]|nr:ABC transporter ATP-binding protein [Rubellimicrobium sp.]
MTAAPPKDSDLAVELVGITKRFGAFTANRDVSLAVRRGEIHALIGENGAGKTTLMNCLFGMIVPDEGQIRVDGRAATILSPQDAIRLGLGMVHQHFKLVPSLTVAENIFLGMEPTRGGLIDRAAQSARVRDLSRRTGLTVDPDRPVRELSVGIEQRVEILKVLARGARTVILDEPTAVLTPQESRDLFRTLRGFTEAGMSVILITHHLDEVMAASDRVTVLRDGAAIGTEVTAETTEGRLAQMMVGRPVTFGRKARAATGGATVLSLRNVDAHDDRGLQALHDVSFAVRAGEIVAIAGVDGNGQTELAEVISGLRRLSHGQITLSGRDVSGAPADQVRAAGLAHVPADRLVRGVDTRETISANILMGRQHQAPWARGGIIRWGIVREAAKGLIGRFDIRTQGPDAPVKSLSGGNMQKVVLAREFSQEKPFLLVDQPTRGVDIGAMEGIHDEVMRQRAAGVAVLLISVQLDECLRLADRLLVMFNGRIQAEMDPETATLDEIGLQMMGGRTSERAAE